MAFPAAAGGRCIAGFVLVLLATGCSEALDDDVLRFGLPTAPASLDPRFATDAMSYRLVRLLYRAPVRFDDQSRPMADLTTWERVSPRRYRFEIGAGARFHDGTPILAGDLAATYRAVLDTRIASPHRVSLDNVAAIEIVDDRHVDFVLAQSDPSFPGKLFIGVMPAGAASAPRGSGRGGYSGPFALVERRPGGTLLLERRRDGQRVRFEVVKDATVRALKLVSGELDIVQGNLPPEMFAWLRAQPGVAVAQRTGSTFSYIGFNLREGPTANPMVRQAIAHALDIEAIVGAVFQGTARRAVSILPPEHWAGAALEPPAHDPDRAVALLERAGYSGSPLRLEYKTSSDYFRLRLATLLQHQLARVGVELEVKSYDWATFYADVTRGNFQLYGLSWVGIKDPDIFRHAFHSGAQPPAGANRGSLENARIDELIETAQAARGKPGHAGALARLQAALLDVLPYVPLWFEDQLVVMRHEISGYSTDSDGNFDALDHTHRNHALAHR